MVEDDDDDDEDEDEDEKELDSEFWMSRLLTGVSYSSSASCFTIMLRSGLAVEPWTWPPDFCLFFGLYL